MNNLGRHELSRIPIWARVAFAARCAKRALPLSHPISGVAAAIEIAERAAAYAAAAAKAAAFAYADAARPAAAAAGAKAAAYAYAAAARPAAGDAAYAAAQAADAAYAAAKAADGAYAADAAYAAMQRDYELLRETSVSEHWTDDTSVPPEFFGPIWPNGEPEGVPVEIEDPAGDSQLVLTIEVPEGVSESELTAKLIDLAQDADSLHRAHGGAGLKVEDIEIHRDAPVPAEVPK